MRPIAHVIGLVIGLAALGGSARAQVAEYVVIPQARSYSVQPARPGGIEITKVEAAVTVREQAATTALEIHLRNNGPARAEAEVLLPVPDKAAVRGFTFQGAGSEPTARLLPRDEARRIYESIVSRSRDPALLEFAGLNLVQSSVFPVEAGGAQAVRLIYEQVLPADGSRVDYILPRSESVAYTVPWEVDLRIESRVPIATAYSPSHPIDVTRPSPGVAIVRMRASQPGSFRLSYLAERPDGPSASLMAYPDPKVGGGYFLLLAGVPGSRTERPKAGREVTIVIDRSGSMSGEKMKQVREGAKQVISGLDDGESFQVIAYNEAVESFADRPVVKDGRTAAEAIAFIEKITPRGGTNIHDALLEALRPAPGAGKLPIVLFMTDGLPTIGQTSESSIRALATQGNPHRRRVFTFGVGVDVNTPLLDGIAADARGTTTFVLPEEDVEVKVAGVFKRLNGPVLTDPKLSTRDESGRGRVADLFPGTIPDLFEGDQLVVLGRYKGEDPIPFELSGDDRGTNRKFQFRFELDKASTRNAFVPRLWASRKIALLIDNVRKLGASSGEFPPRDHSRDPRVKELVDEIVKLSTEFGILTEYTSFLAEEGTDLTKQAEVLGKAVDNVRERALGVRSGYASVNQEMNKLKLQTLTCADPRNGFYDAQLNKVEVANVQQVNDCAFYKRGSTWIDSRLVSAEAKPRSVVEFGSEQFHALVRRLAEEGRAGTISLRGDILLMVDDQPVLVRAPAGPQP